MGNNQKNDNLESARKRLEQALARLSQKASESKKAANGAEAEQNEAASVYNTLEERFNAVEQENLRLHEQIAALSLSNIGETEGTAGRITALEAEKHAIQQNYDLLKRQYTNLQDEFEGLQDKMSPPGGAENIDTGSTDADAANEIRTLRSALEAAVEERDMIRSELDQVITELEGYLAQNTQTAGGMN